MEIRAVESDVIVIGGGAAGLFAACNMVESGLDVLLLEPNSRLARKLSITGKGRCNITNNCTPEDVIKNTAKNPKFLYSAVFGFTPSDIMKWFEDRGVPLKTERGGRVFPVSDKAGDVVGALENTIKSRRCRIVRDKAVRIIKEDGAVKGVEGKKGEYLSKCVILATGGMSYPKTGSTGDGYMMAYELGHTVTEIKPSLIPIIVQENLFPDVCGLTLKNVTLSLFEQGKKSPLFSEIGEVTFTDYGIAGPLTLSASCFISSEKLEERKYKIVIDLKPGLTSEQLEKRIQRDFDEYPNKAFADSLSRLLPSQIIPDIVFLSGISLQKPCAQITKQEKTALAGLLKRFSLTPIGLRPIEEAIITSGGVSVKEISPTTMESKLVKGLYFAGEIIDCDALTGGYNLTIAFSTAYSAAQAIISTILSKEV